MAKKTEQEIRNAVWAACDTFRGVIDPSQYKDYILTMLFVTFLSDLRKDRLAHYEKRYKGDKTRIQRAMSRERFSVPEDCDFDYLYAQREAANIGETINNALDTIEDANKTKLENVFRNIDFNSEAALGRTKERNRRLKLLLDDFNKLDLQPTHLEDADVIGDIYEYLIGLFAAGAGKKAGEFYTPSQVSRLLAKLMAPKSGDRICDPTCGSGSLLIRVANEIPDKNFQLAGQELNGSTWALSKMNMFLHNIDAARIEWCDTINNPQLIEEDDLTRFDVVVANPPFSLDKWGAENAESDRFKRFWRGVPPKSKGDYAFISHMISIAIEGKGKVGVIVPHGVLFRGGKEGLIRRQFIEENLLEAVIGLSPNLFFGTGIPTAILVFNKGKTTSDILFIDASKKCEQGKNQNVLRDDDIEDIVDAYKAFATVDKFAYRATFEEIEDAEFNLNIPRYVDTFKEEDPVDIPAVQERIVEIEAQLVETRKRLDGYLMELEVGEREE